MHAAAVVYAGIDVTSTPLFSGVRGAQLVVYTHGTTVDDFAHDLPLLVGE